MNNFLTFLMNLLHIHVWYYGAYSLGARSKYTGDLIGRRERQCINCECKQISISQLSLKHKKEVHAILGKKKYYEYKHGDWLDVYTRSKLLTNKVDQLNKAETLMSIVGDGSQLLKF